MEQTTTRRDAVHDAMTHGAVFNQPNVGMVVMRGADCMDLLQRLTTNDLAQVRPGSGSQTVLLTDKARIIDVLTVLHTSEETYLLCSAGNSGRVTSWLRNYIIMDDVKVADRSTEVRSIRWVGVEAPQLVQQHLGQDVRALPLAGFVEHVFDGAKAITVRIPATCELEYITLLFTQDQQLLTDIPVPFLTEAELEYLRVMRGVGKHGCEWTDAYNPLEAGLLHMVNFSKGCYIGQEVVARLDSYNKVKQRIMGMSCLEQITAGCEIKVGEDVVGVTTSVVPSRIQPGGFYALGYVRNAFALDDTVVTINVSNVNVPAKLHQLPMMEA